MPEKYREMAGTLPPQSREQLPDAPQVFRPAFALSPEEMRELSLCVDLYAQAVSSRLKYTGGEAAVQERLETQTRVKRNEVAIKSLEFLTERRPEERIRAQAFFEGDISAWWIAACNRNDLNPQDPSVQKQYVQIANLMIGMLYVDLENAQRTIVLLQQELREKITGITPASAPQEGEHA